MRYLTVPEVVDLIDQTLGGGPPHIRDLGLLEGAVARPQAGMFGVEAYPDLHTKAAALMHSLITSHPLFDGNKRVGITATLAFLSLNNRPVLATDDELFDLTLQVANGLVEDVVDLAVRLQGLA